MPLEKGVTGYIENSAIDWSGLTNGLSKTVYDIGEKREIRKQELDDQWTDMNTQLESAEIPENQTLGDIFLNTTNAGTSKALEWNKQLKAGKISPEQYTRLMNNLKQNFDGFVSTAATFDKRYKEYMERQQTGKASALELDFASKFGKMAELNGKSSIIDMDGNIKLANIDPATGKVTDFYDMRTMNKPENIIDNKVILGDEVEAYTKSWESTELWKELGRNGWKSIDTARQTPGYKFARENVVKALVNESNPRKTLSILADNGGIQLTTYTNDAEKSKLIEAAKNDLIDTKRRAGESTMLSPEELKQIELNMVKLERDPRNVFQPKLTEEQIEKARKIAGDAVDVSIGQKMEGAARSYYKPSDTGGGGGEKEKEPNTDLRDTIKSAFVNPTSPKSPIDRKFMANRLTALSGGKIVVTVPTQKGVIGYMVKRADSTAPPINIQNARDISPYFFGPGEKGIYSFDEQEELARQGGQANSIEPTTKDASIDWKNLDKLVKAKGKKLEEGQAGEIGRAIKAEIKNNPKKNPYTIYKEVVDNYFSGNISSSGNNEDIKFDADGNIIM
jgi:hypothetical protein